MEQEEEEENICDGVISIGARGCRPEGVISGVCTSTGGSPPGVTIWGVISRRGVFSGGVSSAFGNRPLYQLSGLAEVLSSSSVRNTVTSPNNYSKSGFLTTLVIDSGQKVEIQSVVFACTNVVDYKLLQTVTVGLYF